MCAPPDPFVGYHGKLSFLLKRDAKAAAKRLSKKPLRADLPVGAAKQGGRQQRDAFADDGSLVDKAGADHAEETSVREAGSEHGTFDT